MGSMADRQPSQGNLHVTDPSRAAAACETLEALEAKIPHCVACPRLVAHRQAAAMEKVKRFRQTTYWGRPVAGFGDRNARILIVGLAPGAHGANRTGRVFTGDRSGDFLFAGLHRAGLSNQAASSHSGDGLQLHGVYVSAAARCVPPANKPTSEELVQCQPYLLRELTLLQDLRVVVALGAIGHKGFIGAYEQSCNRNDAASVRRSRFAHGAQHSLPDGLALLDCYHVSQQNTFTGRLTPDMFDSVLRQAKQIAKL